MVARSKKRGILATVNKLEAWEQNGTSFMTWEKGVSGNPSGRPREVGDLRKLAQEKTQAALDTLTEIMLNENAKDSARVAAASAILDRGYGKPTTFIETTSDAPLMSLEEAARRIAFAMNAPGGGKIIDVTPQKPDVELSAADIVEARRESNKELLKRAIAANRKAKANLEAGEPFEKPPAPERIDFSGLPSATLKNSSEQSEHNQD